VEAKRIIKRLTQTDDFAPGIYEHWKGGRYRALMLAWAHDLGGPEQWAVVYISLTNGKVFLRAWDSPDLDAWTDLIELEDNLVKQRFQWIGP